MHSIYKKGSKAEATNYRGVHLTPQLSKVVERAVGTILLPWLEKQGAFGPNQYAYGKGKGYKDVLTINVCSWILAMEKGDLVGLYCSDVSGAFDRVSRDRLESKLRLLGLHPQLLGFLISWLEDRVSEVVVGGQRSAPEPLCDSVFQGTVLGPPLWNCFYKDSRRAAEDRSFTETVFADDFNCFRRYRKGKLPQDLRAALELRGMQKELHSWGKANQVRFDPNKESFHHLHRRLYSGGEFKILGVLFDTQLLMHAAARHVATEAGWRLQQLLKGRRHFTTPELVHLYKAQVLSFVESSTPGLYHAAPTVLDRVDRVQRRLLRELGLDELQALLNFRLAPLPSRRDMAMLGALHKVTLGLAPPQLAAFFPAQGKAGKPLRASTAQVLAAAARQAAPHGLRHHCDGCDVPLAVRARARVQPAPSARGGPEDGQELPTLPARRAQSLRLSAFSSRRLASTLHSWLEEAYAARLRQVFRLTLHIFLYIVFQLPWWPQPRLWSALLRFFRFLF